MGHQLLCHFWHSHDRSLHTVLSSPGRDPLHQYLLYAILIHSYLLNILLHCQYPTRPHQNMEVHVANYGGGGGGGGIVIVV